MEVVDLQLKKWIRNQVEIFATDLNWHGLVSSMLIIIQYVFIIIVLSYNCLLYYSTNFALNFYCCELKYSSLHSSVVTNS